MKACDQKFGALNFAFVGHGGRGSIPGGLNKQKRIVVFVFCPVAKEQGVRQQTSKKGDERWDMPRPMRDRHGGGKGKARVLAVYQQGAARGSFPRAGNLDR